MQSAIDELRFLASGAQNRKTDTGIPRVAMVQGKVPEHQLSAVYEPMVNLILQGRKTMTVGDQNLHYNPSTYFVMSVDLPAIGTVHPASNGAPYLAVSLTLDTQVLAQLLTDLPESAQVRITPPGFSVASVTPELLDAWVRMLRLMHHPDDIPALAPVYEREILYRVLRGPQGGLLREIATPDSAMGRISQAIRRIRSDYQHPLPVETLAEHAAMSVSAFHRHFKAVTALSPLQYQKRIRLLQARGLLISGGHNATAAAHAVGYESVTQFNREYAREFGLSPGRDTANIRGRG